MKSWFWSNGKLKIIKEKLIPGTEDYDLVYHRLYEEELTKEDWFNAKRMDIFRKWTF